MSCCSGDSVGLRYYGRLQGFNAVKETTKQTRLEAPRLRTVFESRARAKLFSQALHLAEE
jgi:hypothetical protein